MRKFPQQPIITFFSAGLATGFLLPLPALAASDINTPEKVIAAICKFSGWLYAALLALAVLFIIYAAFLFLTAGGDAERVGTAKKQLIYAVVAVAAAILATGIIRITQELLGTPTSVC